MSKTPKLLAKYEPDEPFELVMDPSGITRESVLKTSREIFGSAEDDTDLLGRLVDSILSVRDSRDKVTQEMVSMGGQLSHIYQLIRNNQIKKAGEDTRAVRDRAAGLAWHFIEMTLSMSQTAARQLIRCHEKFVDNAAAIRNFSISDLTLMVKPAITDEHISVLIEKKLAKPNMSRLELQREIAEIVSTHQELIQDAEERAARLNQQLEEKESELDLAERANRRMQEELATVVKDRAEKEKALKSLDADISIRSQHYASLQKKSNDLQEEVKRLTAAMRDLENAKPVAETKEVIVEKLPEAIQNLEETLESGLAKLKAVKKERDEVQAEVAQLRETAEQHRADIEAGSAAQRILEEVLAAWEHFAAKYSTAQLAVQAGKNVGLYMPTLLALSGMLTKILSELDTVTMRKAA